MCGGGGSGDDARRGTPDVDRRAAGAGGGGRGEGDRDGAAHDDGAGFAGDEAGRGFKRRRGNEKEDEGAGESQLTDDRNRHGWDGQTGDGGADTATGAIRVVKREAGATPKGSDAEDDSARAPSRSSPSAAPNVKLEPLSPQPVASPVQQQVKEPSGGGSVALASVFPPHYFLMPHLQTTDAQASEMLARISEMAHHRLQRQASVAFPVQTHPGAIAAAAAGGPFFAARGAGGGVTCVECNINFTSFDNFMVHKQLYCAYRQQRQQQQQPMGNGTARDKPGRQAGKTVHCSPADKSGSPSPTALARQSAPVGADCAAADGGGVAPAPAKAIKAERAEEPARPSGDEGRGPEGSPPSGADMATEDPARTTCDACNITFSRRENYAVHKRYYCATRHDPPPKRQAHGGRAASVAAAPAAATVVAVSQNQQQQQRTRKRRRAFGVAHPEGAPGGRRLADAASPPGDDVAKRRREERTSSSCSSSTSPAASTASSSGSPLRCTASSATAAAAATPGVGAHRTAGSTGAARRSPYPSPPPPQDADAPMDLSRKTAAPTEQPATPRRSPETPARLSDYHKCASCQITFSRLENYLAHKRYYCSATTTRQPAAAALPGAPPPLAAALLTGSGASPLGPGVPVLPFALNSVVAAPAGRTAPRGTPVAAPGGGGAHGCLLCPEAPTDLARFPGLAPLAETKPALCPYCSYACSSGDGMEEHRRRHHGASTPGLPPEARGSRSPTPPGNDGAAGDDADGAAEGPAIAGAAASPGPLAPSPRLTPAGRGGSPAPALSPFHTPGKTAAEPPALANGGGGGKYCRLCDIQFSSLSNFIAHKKFYCASHAAEHHAVK